jgi:hypothetical protein
VGKGASRAIEVGSPMPMPEMSVGPMLPKGKEPPAIPPGVDPMEPSERSLPPEDPDDGNPRAISTMPLVQSPPTDTHLIKMHPFEPPKFQCRLPTFNYKTTCTSSTIIKLKLHNEFSTAESQKWSKQFLP